MTDIRNYLNNATASYSGTAIAATSSDPMQGASEKGINELIFR